MKLNIWTAAERGRSLWLANALRVSPPMVSDWCTGKKSIPVERCVPIERATEGAVTRKDTRPDDWQDIWPELAQVPANIATVAIETIAPKVKAPADIQLRVAPRRHDEKPSTYAHSDIDRRDSDGLTEHERRAGAQAAAEAATARGVA